MKKEHNVFFIVFLICFIGIFLIPLFRPGFIVTDDGDWMVIRLTAFYQSFADGQFPVRFLMRLNNNYGYPVSNFLYPGFLYIGSFLRLFRLPYVLIVKLILGGSTLLSVLFCFFWLKKFFSNFQSFIGSSTLMASPYFLYDMYKRGSVGELMATATVMVLLWSIESGFIWLIPPVIAFLLISHNTLSFFFIIIFLLYISIRKKFDVLLPFIIGVWIASFFWIPALFERTFIRFDAVKVANPLDYISVSQVLLLMSFPFFIPLVYFFSKKKISLEKEFLFFSSMALLAAIGSSIFGIFFLKMPFFAQFVQFPYRLLSVLFIAGPWLLAFFIAHQQIKKQIWIGISCILVLCIVNIPSMTSVKNVIREEGFYVTNEGTTTVQDEYMPRWAVKKPDIRASAKLVFFSGRGVIDNIVSSTKKIDADLRVEGESVLQFNTLFYPGWGVSLDGKPVTMSYDNTEGLMRVIIPNGNHHISFEFRETVFRYIADTLSGIGVMLYGIYLLSFLVRKSKKKPVI